MHIWITLVIVKLLCGNFYPEPYQLMLSLTWTKHAISNHGRPRDSCKRRVQSAYGIGFRKVDLRLPGTGHSNAHGARTVIPGIHNGSGDAVDLVMLVVSTKVWKEGSSGPQYGKGFNTPVYLRSSLLMGPMKLAGRWGSLSPGRSPGLRCSFGKFQPERERERDSERERESPHPFTRL